jgi:hypothetical protein
VGDDLHRCWGGFLAHVIGWWPHGLAKLSSLSR